MTIWMNILERKLKDFTILFLMTLFPIILTVLFVNMFTLTEDVEKSINFSVSVKQEKGLLGQTLGTYFKQVEESSGIGISVKDGVEADFVIEVNEDTQEIYMVNQQGEMMEEIVLANLIDEFATAYSIGQVTGYVEGIDMAIPEEVIESKVKADITIPLVATMLIFGIMLGGNFGIKQVVYMKQAVGRRTFTAALSKGKLFAMEYTTSVLIICITGIIGMVVYQIIYHIDFMSAWVGCIGLLIGASLMTTLLGMTIGLYVKEEDMGGNILSLIVTLSAILSGKLMPMFELGDVTQLSPIKPLIEALEELVQYGRFSNGDVLLVYLVGVLGILGGLVVIKLKRQEEVQ